MSRDNNEAIKNAKNVQITPEIERRMRLIANLIIDKIFEDKQKKVLKFEANSLTNKEKKQV